MKTAEEWYNLKVIELMTQREQGNIDVLEFRNQLDLLLEQSNKMFEDQIMEAWNSAAGGDGFSSAGQYYISNFKSE
jgi:hypothetical protein